MVGTGELRQLLRATTQVGAKTVLVGDAHQLAPVPTVPTFALIRTALIRTHPHWVVRIFFTAIKIAVSPY
jgi:hypothetical protein